MIHVFILVMNLGHIQNLKYTAEIQNQFYLLMISHQGTMCFLSKSLFA